MMTKSRPSHNAILRKIAASIIFLFLGVSFMFIQDNKLTGNTINYEKGWWRPIVQKHNIDMKTFNLIYEIKTDSLNFVLLSKFFKMGTSDSLNKKVSNFKDAIFIFQEINDTYWIITSESVSQDSEKKIFECKNGIMECFSFKTTDTIPIKSTTYNEIQFNAKENSMTIKGPSSDK